MNTIPEFGTLLLRSARVDDLPKQWEAAIQPLGEGMCQDTVAYQGSGRYKNHQTVAAMMCYSSSMRELMTSRQRDQFDALVNEMRVKWLELSVKRVDGVKVHNALARTQVGQPVPF